jgi:release factor glutamine methyltransferase
MALWRSEVADANTMINPDGAEGISSLPSCAGSLQGGEAWASPLEPRTVPGPLAASAELAPVEIRGGDLLAWRRLQLQEGGQPADLDWLLAMAANLDWCSLQRLRISPEGTVCLAVSLEHLEALWQRHCHGDEPLQYLVGVCPWRDLELAVAPGVLIPRQETELLVDLAVAVCADHPPALWADLGTGSGCLAAALALQWPASAGLAVDRSPEALSQAAVNLRRAGCGARVQLLEGCWWQPLQPWWGRLEVVVANPPYIPTAVWSALDPGVRDHEPRLALDGGIDGLVDLRQIAAGAREGLAPGGWLLLEHHHDQSAAVDRLLREAGLEAVAVHADLEGTLRFALARSPLASRPDHEADALP